jgi:hypothetical protein
MSRMPLDELERNILSAHALGDTRTLERLQAEYRSRSDVGVIRDGGPAPTLIWPAGDIRSTTTTTTRSKAAPGVTPAERAARIEAITDEIPELRSNAKPTLTVTLTRLARETIHGELAFSRRFMEDELGETGGWLLGERVPGKWLVSATDLGAGTRMSKRCVLDYEQARHEAYRATLSSRSFSRKFLGVWHVHPVVGYTEPSSTDRKNALAYLEYRELNPAEFALDIIVSPHADRGWNSPQFTAWATRRDRWAGAITEPATIAGLTADVNWYME